MSFSQPQVSNPCKKFVEFKGDKGVWQYYDKEKQSYAEIPAPIFLVILDQLSTVRGFSDNTNSGIYANEVHSLTKETLRVKTFKGGFVLTGKYSEIKGDIAKEGGKFCKSVYAMMFDADGNRELINLQITGAALHAWMELKFHANDHIVAIENELLEGKKGSVKYRIPVFKRYNMKKELIAPAIEMDKELQAFFAQRKSDQEEVNTENDAASGVVPSDIPPTPEEIYHAATYEQDKGKVYDRVPDNNVPPEFPDDDLPF